jgi:iron complex outermembrane recepter protein
MRLITSEPRREQSSTSGEARIGRSFAEGDRLHSLTLALRARDRRNEYGGGATVDFGPQRFDDALDTPEPDFSFGPQTRERVRQWTPGLGYGLRWRGLGSLQLGVQRTAYRKRIFLPVGDSTQTREQAWLLNAAAALELTPRLALYGSYARGLEESGVAPDSAVNRGQALPAIFTRQVDAGPAGSCRTTCASLPACFRSRNPISPTMRPTASSSSETSGIGASSSACPAHPLRACH